VLARQRGKGGSVDDITVRPGAWPAASGDGRGHVAQSARPKRRRGNQPLALGSSPTAYQPGLRGGAAPSPLRASPTALL